MCTAVCVCLTMDVCSAAHCPLLPGTRVSPAFHHQQVLMQSFLLSLVHCPLAARDTEGNGNQGQSPQCLHFLRPCAGLVSVHGQQPEQLAVLQQD